MLRCHAPLVVRRSAHSHLRRRACGGRCSLLDNDGRVVNDSPLKVTPCQQPLQCCTPCELTTDRRSCLAPYQLGRVDDLQFALPRQLVRSEEHTSELQSLMRISYAVFCLKKKTTTPIHKKLQHSDTLKENLLTYII